MIGGEITILENPSMTSLISRVINPDAIHEIVGVRHREKLHEQMIGLEDAPYTYEYREYY